MPAGTAGSSGRVAAASGTATSDTTGMAGVTAKAMPTAGSRSPAAPSTGGTGGTGATGTKGDKGAAGDDARGGAPQAAADMPAWNDPGTDEWQPVPKEKVADECKLDPDMLAANDGMFTSGWAVVRYGKLCHEAGPPDMPSEVWSTTKTLGGVVTGVASYETRMFDDTGPKTGQLLDTDYAVHWLDNVTYNQEALVAHVLAMEAHNSDLSWGKKTYSYDTVGTVEINSLGQMVNAAIAQDSARLGSGIEMFTKNFVFAPLGMKNSTWNGQVYAYTWSTTLRDMARIGVLLAHQGIWSGKRLLDESWIYKMTHPAFEDANTGYGYLTWLNARVGSTGPGGAFSGTAADTCAPACLWPKYPHPVSDAPDCQYQGMSCEQEQDVGAWSAQGLGGQFILVHPGLDLVIVAKNYSSMGAGGSPSAMWNAVRPALVKYDPMFMGDEKAFCEAYANNQYAPDLLAPWEAPYDTPTPKK